MAIPANCLIPQANSAAFTSSQGDGLQLVFKATTTKGPLRSCRKVWGHIQSLECCCFVARTLLWSLLKQWKSQKCWHFECFLLSCWMLWQLCMQHTHSISQHSRQPDVLERKLSQGLAFKKECCMESIFVLRTTWISFLASHLWWNELRIGL